MNRPDLVSLKHPDKLGTLIMKDEKEPSRSFFLFDINSPLRIIVIATIKSKYTYTIIKEILINIFNSSNNWNYTFLYGRFKS